MQAHPRHVLSNRVLNRAGPDDGTTQCLMRRAAGRTDANGAARACEVTARRTVPASPAGRPLLPPMQGRRGARAGEVRETPAIGRDIGRGADRLDPGITQDATLLAIPASAT
jgi:hypothetical protein